jgi:hypothetical protein
MVILGGETPVNSLIIGLVSGILANVIADMIVDYIRRHHKQ